MVVYTVTPKDFTDTLDKNKQGVVVYFSTTSWGPCQEINPEYQKLSDNAAFKNVLFLKVDVDSEQALAEACNVQQTPTFMTFENGLGKRQIEGGDETSVNSVTSLLEELGQQGVPSPPGAHDVERRVDPYDGAAYTFDELMDYYSSPDYPAGAWDKPSIQRYWDKSCKRIAKL